MRVLVPLTVAVTWFPRSAGEEQDIFLDGDAVTALDLLEALDVTPDTVLIVRSGVPIPLDARLSDGESVRIVHTVSGG